MRQKTYAYSVSLTLKYASALLLVLAVSRDAMAQSLDQVLPSVQHVHGMISLRGNGFGTTQGTSRVRFSDGNTTVDAGRAYLWRDDRIEIRVPVGMQDGMTNVPIPKVPLSIFVETTADASNGLTFEVATTSTGELAFSELTTISANADVSTALGSPNMNLARTKEAEIGDVDADGWPDLLDNNSANVGNGTHHVLRRNARDRSFVAIALEPHSAGDIGDFATEVPPGGTYANDGVTYDSDFADITGDGLPDIIQTMTTSSTSNFLRLLINGRDGIAGQFTEDSSARLPLSAFNLLACPDDVDHADVDNDGDIDFAVTLRRFGACAGAPTESATNLYINQGTGTFAEPIVFAAPAAQSSHDVFFVDANSDGFADVMIVYEDGSGSRLHINNANPLNPAFIESDEFPTGYAGDIADFNGDGFEDFVIGRNQATVFLNDPDSPGTFSEVSLPVTGGGPIYDFEPGDVDLDGDVDIVGARITSMANDAALIWLNNGSGAFTLAAGGIASVLLPGIADIQRLSADLLDIDLDGDLDLYLAGPDLQNIGNGAGKVPNQLFENLVRSFDIVEPTRDRPAYAGTSSEGRRVLMRLRDSGGPPISLVDLVATIDGDPATIITGSMIEGEFWALIDAPTRADGCYELAINRAGSPPSSDIEKDSICYADDRHFARAVTIDRTGSMNFDSALGISTGEKMAAAREAAKLFVDLSQGDDQIGVTSFQRDADDGDGVVELFELVRRDAELVSSEVGAVDNRPAVRGAISGVDPDGPGFSQETSIGAGVIESLAMLQSDGNPDFDHEIIVITDGQENFAPFWRNPGIGGPVEPLVLAATPETRVNTVAIGTGANALLLQQMAEATGGRFRNLVENAGLLSLSLAARMSDSLKAIDEHTRDEQRFHYEEGLPEKFGKILVEPDLAETAIAFYWDTPLAVDIVLNAPDGSTVIDTLPDVSVEQDAQHVIYRIASPLPGEWTYTFERSEDADFDFFVAASGLSPVVMRSGPGTMHRYDEGGFQMPVRVFLADFKAITTSNINATITRPDGSIIELVLRDTGGEMDGGFADGIYGSQFSDKMPGIYDIALRARGTSNKGAPFVRQLSYSVVYQVGGPAEDPGEPKPEEDQRRADLVVQPFEGSAINVECPDGAASCVTSVKLSILNEGEQRAKSSTTRIVSDPQLRQVTEQRTPTLEPDEKFEFEFRSVPGRNCFDPDCMVCVMADFNASVIESDENNNLFCALGGG